MKRFILNISVFLIFVALLSSSVFASAIMPMSDGALDIAYVEMEENQYNSILYAIEALAEVPSSLKTGWSSGYPTGFVSSWYNRVVSLLDTIADNTAAGSSGSGSSGSGSSSGNSALNSGWSTSYPTGYSSSWYYKIITLLDDLQPTDFSFLNSGWSYTYPSTYSSSWYNRVVSELDDLNTPISSLSSTVNNGWSNMISYLVNLPLIMEDTTSLDTHLDLFYKSYQDDIKSLKTDLGLSVLRLDDIRSDLSTFYNYVKSEIPYRLETQILYLTDIEDILAGVGRNVSSILQHVTPKPFEDDIKESQADERHALYSGLKSDSHSSDIVSLFSLKKDFSEFFSVDGYNVSQVFTQIEEGSSQWFSSDTADALSVGGGVSAASFDDPVSDTPLLDQRMSEIASYFTGGE